MQPSTTRHLTQLLLALGLCTAAATAFAQDAAQTSTTPPAPAPAPAGDELPPAPPPPPAADAPDQPPPPPPPAATAAARPCPLGQRRNADGHCVTSDPDPWTEGDAPVPPSLTGHHTHDGFMLRMSAGLGLAGATTDVPVLGEVQVGGLGWLAGIDVGGSLADNLVLHGRLNWLTVIDPTVKLEGDEVAEADGARLRITHLAPAITYYIMPTNLYLTGSVGLTVAELEDDADTIETDVGWGLQAEIGKEWWVDSDWGLGVAARLHLGRVPLDGIDAHSDLLGLGVLFTATYQ